MEWNRNHIPRDWNVFLGEREQLIGMGGSYLAILLLVHKEQRGNGMEWDRNHISRDWNRFLE